MRVDLRLDTGRRDPQWQITDPATNTDDDGRMIRDPSLTRFHTAYMLVGFYLSTPEVRARLTDRDPVLLHP